MVTAVRFRCSSGMFCDVLPLSAAWVENCNVYPASSGGINLILVSEELIWSVLPCFVEM